MNAGYCGATLSELHNGWEMLLSLNRFKIMLAHMCSASSTDYSASKVAKIVVRHKIVSVRAEGYVSQQSSTPEKPKGKFFL